MAAPDAAKDIAAYLNTLGYADPVTVEILSPTPINQYAVIAYAGKNIKTHGGTGAGGSGVVLDETYIQIQSRNANRQAAKANLLVIVNALDGLSDITVNGINYTYIQEISVARPFAKQVDGSSVFIWECLCQSRRI